MAHLYRAEEWECLDRWYVNDTDCVDSRAPYWWVPARILDLSLVDYVSLLKDKFNAGNFSFDKNILLFSFKSQADARAYKNYINAAARKRNFII